MGLFNKFNEIDNERKINKKINNFFENEDYLNRLKLRYSHVSVDLDKIKLIFESEINKSNFKEFNMNQRYLEILKMDVDTLYDMCLKGMDTSKFIIQKDLDDYFGDEYAMKYKNEREVLDNNPSYEEPLKSITPLYNKYKRKNAEKTVKFGPKRESVSDKSNQSAERLKKLLYDNDSVHEETHFKEVNSIKNKLPLISEVNIELFTKVKSNTALASTALFLATGVLVAEAKEEMKWVKTKLNIKDDGIIIKKPYSIYKYKNFHQFKVDKKENYYLFYIGLNDDDMIVFRTKEKYLLEVIVDKINNLN